jgi:hypothetical protein
MKAFIRLSRLACTAAAALALTLSVAESAAAQTCLGYPSFRRGSVRLNVGGYESPDGQAYAGAISAGRADGVFAGVGGGYAIDDSTDVTSSAVTLEGGYQISFSRNGPQLCPILGAGLIFGPYDLDGVDYTTVIATGGLALGVPFSLFSGLRIVPNVAVRYEYDSQKQLLVDGSESFRANQSFGVVDVGFAWVIADALSIQPTYQKVFGLDEEIKGSYGVLLSLRVPWR